MGDEDKVGKSKQLKGWGVDPLSLSIRFTDWWMLETADLILARY
jgi:hypothetical protein